MIVLNSKMVQNKQLQVQGNDVVAIFSVYDSGRIVDGVALDIGQAIKVRDYLDSLIDTHKQAYSG